MATPPRADGPTLSAYDQARTRQRLEQLRWFRELGQAVLRAAADKKLSLSQASAEIAGHQGIRANYAMHAAHFVRRFPEPDFQRLLDLRLRDRMPVPLRSVVKVLYAKDRKPIAWLVQAARAGWSADLLGQHVQRVKQGRSWEPLHEAPGRAIREPRRLEEGLDAIELLARRWLKRCRGPWRPDAAWWRAGPAGVPEAAELRRRRQEVLKLLGALRSALDELSAHVERRVTIRAPRGSGRTRR
jgi:hypothetical protein